MSEAFSVSSKGASASFFLELLMWRVEVGEKKLSDVKKGQERQKGCTL